MDDELIDTVIRELLESDDVEEWLRVGRIVEEELVEAVDDLDTEDDFVDNEVLDDVLLRRLLGEFVLEDDLESVALDEKVDVGEEDDDLEFSDDLEDVGDDDNDIDSLEVCVAVREEVVERDTEIELVEVRVIKDDHVQ